MAKEINDICSSRVRAVKDIYETAQSYLLNTIFTIKSESIDAGYTIKSEEIIGNNISQPEHIKTAYKIRSITTTKKLSEWYASYTPEEEADRLLLLQEKIKQGESVSCAEILQTCDLPPSDPGHKKMFFNKINKIHPDKAKFDKAKAGDATAVLNRVKNTTKNCQGQNGQGCIEGAFEVTIRKELVTLDSRYAKLLKIEPECLLYPEEGDVPRSLLGIVQI